MLLVGCEVSDGKRTIQTYPYSNCIFHHQNSQRKQTCFTVPTNLGKTLANIICCMCLFQHVGKQDRTHARTSMVKIALRKLFAGILCGCVVLLVGCEVIDGKKPSKPIHILTAFSTTKIHKENKQVLPYHPTLLKTLTNIICCMCLFQHVGKQDRTHARTHMVKIAWRKLVAGILCGRVVLLVGCEVSDGKKKTIQTYPYCNCIFHHQNSQRKQTNFTVPPDLIENFDQHNLLYVSLPACWKTGQNPCKNTHGENCIAQVGCWYFVRLCGAAGVGGEVSDEKNNPNTSIFELHFHHQNSQRKQTNFKVPTNLIENFGQHNLLYVSLSAWKTGEKLCKNKHGENCIAQIVCWYFVRLCGAAGVGCEVSEGKKPSKPIHILTALFTTRIHKENKQVLPYQPTSGKLWPT